MCIKKIVHTFCDDLFQRFTRCPELIKFITTLDPILPRPMKPKAIDDAEIFLFFKSTETLFKSIFGDSCNKIPKFKIHSKLQVMITYWLAEDRRKIENLLFIRFFRCTIFVKFQWWRLLSWLFCGSISWRIRRLTFGSRTLFR